MPDRRPSAATRPDVGEGGFAYQLCRERVNPAQAIHPIDIGERHVGEFGAKAGAEVLPSLPDYRVGEPVLLVSEVVIDLAAELTSSTRDTQIDIVDTHCR